MIKDIAQAAMPFLFALCFRFCRLLCRRILWNRLDAEYKIQDVGDPNSRKDAARDPEHRLFGHFYVPS